MIFMWKYATVMLCLAAKRKYNYFSVGNVKPKGNYSTNQKDGGCYLPAKWVLEFINILQKGYC